MARSVQICIQEPCDMKTSLQVSPEKLRGGFYTPAPLVDFCLERVAALRPSEPLRVLEPAAGDGAFIRGLLARRPDALHLGDVTAVELLDAEAAKCEELLAGRGGRVVRGSVLSWALETGDTFDAAVGNPPFVRFQFVSPADRAAASELSRRVGPSVEGVANLWIPVLLAALCRLRRGGVFAFVLPTECFTGAAAGRMREWLLESSDALRLDLFPPGSFPGALQEIAVLSGIRAPSARPELAICQHSDTGSEALTTLPAAVDRTSWTRYLLAPGQHDVLTAVIEREVVRPMPDVARFEVSIVTGANDFFTVGEEAVERWQLDSWCEPLLARIRHAPGLIFSANDHQAVRDDGLPAWILNFSADCSDPELSSRPAEYLDGGVQRELNTRFKCRIREPWYRVPNFQRGDLLLSKRSHLFPRVVVNEAAVFTTDTIYRGRIVDEAISPRAFASTFHNSLTLLMAELEGRTFGGGVLELVPSEINRLLVPRVAEAATWLAALDRTYRESQEETLVAVTDQHLVKAGVFSVEEAAVLADARTLLLDRRLERSTLPRKASSQRRLAA